MRWLGPWRMPALSHLSKDRLDVLRFAKDELLQSPPEAAVGRGMCNVEEDRQDVKALTSIVRSLQYIVVNVIEPSLLVR